MCGIAGVLSFNGVVDPVSIARMVEIQAHRGPDDEGYCLINSQTLEVKPCSGNDTVAECSYPSILSQHTNDFDAALGHRRLSIIDTSPAGHQPMCSTDGSCWLVYNGEIYNYLELREELRSAGYRFRSNTDTEVILAAYQTWNEECLQRFNGMWAFALWDSRRRQLFCARDRFGIKPFYYFYDAKEFRFASEIKALASNPTVRVEPNNRLVFEYLTNQISASSETFFKGISQLQPAHYLTLDIDQLRSNGEEASGKAVKVVQHRFWDIDLDKRLENRANANYGKHFYELLEDSVRLHLRGDVPIGTCLSGGLDSSSIVCVVNRLLRLEGVAERQIGERQKTFSSCFDDLRFDERKYIEEVLAATGAERNYVFPNGQRLIEELPHLVWHQDEPFGSTSIYAQWNVFRRVAERKIKIILDGQGGDEVLAGYPLYYASYHLDLLTRGSWGDLRGELQKYGVYHNHAAPVALRNLLSLGAHTWFSKPSEQIKTVLGHTLDEAYPYLNKDYVNSYKCAGNGQSHKINRRFQEQMYENLVAGLPYLLRYEDRNSMAFSIEGRVPFLDYRLVEYAFALPDNQKIRHGLTKFVLREATRGLLPEKIRLRTDKMGFVTPEAVWFREGLATFVRETFRSAPQRVLDYFDTTAVEQLVQKAAQGESVSTTSAGISNTLWRVLNLCIWFDVFHVGEA